MKPTHPLYTTPTTPALVTIALALLLLVAGCRFFSKRSSNGDVPVARVQNTYLYRSQLQGLVNPGTPPQDSAATVNNYINNWVRRQAMLLNAGNEITATMPNLEQQLQDYRESLLLHAFEQQLLQQNPDTLIDPAETETYYQQNKDNFVLGTNVVKVAYVITGNKAEKQDSVKLLLKKNTPDALQTLLQLCNRQTFTCALPARWYAWTELQQQIPLDDSDFTTFLQNHFFQTHDAVYTYYISIDTAAKQGSTAPIGYCKPEVEKIIAHKHSLRYLENTRKQIYEDAINNGLIEIYQHNP
ncbi:hypothetical protein C7N43_00500 [Sphingobacteriales bacterium UPWRP_1]|nr:hypothetical protein BVG80_15430 [Sphingobacteriales bacterium TSM_CSM]PSJ79138.1 hypothetical protein C7N43_00500 [Sphingobacteriales bacterium UPWRP_1]